MPIESPARGPFDLVGDVHGCLLELEELLTRLGYRCRGKSWTHPRKRKVVFLGDIGDRGPFNLATINLVIKLLIWWSREMPCMYRGTTVKN
ncbi:Calcineurin-like phosphoesterase [Desulfofundulus australicus DSM 11792]|uniref:Calcineurin-like phosphoesterase n=1 Tax=Desulfofundulus australicus DSM 11792 TaxID=1121425 RepID=A0A1M5B3H9_9FIRM|nr:Calcineurin-like phosphoesterase [Desulfofundulus australicus DSM 11792]